MPQAPDTTLGEAVCAALRGQVSKLGLSIGDEPVWAEATFEEALEATRKEAKTQVDTFKIGTGTNNTGLHSQGSALAAFCYLGDTAGRDKAAGNLGRLADYLVLADGSDRE